MIVVAYLGCMRLTYKYERGRSGDARTTGERQAVGTGLYAGLAITALILVAAAWWLARLGDTLSTHRIELIGRQQPGKCPSGTGPAGRSHYSL